VLLKVQVFSCMTPGWLVNSYRPFGGAWWLHLQGKIWLLSLFSKGILRASFLFTLTTDLLLQTHCYRPSDICCYKPSVDQLLQTCNYRLTVTTMLLEVFCQLHCYRPSLDPLLQTCSYRPTVTAMLLLAACQIHYYKPSVRHNVIELQL
jgi:hypothetical protein